MKTAIIIVNYNNSEYTNNCLSSLEKIKKGKGEIKVFVVDNGSSEKISLKKTKFENFDFQLIVSDANLGFSGGNNLAIKKSLAENFEYIVLLNNDTTQDPEFINKLIEASEKSGAQILSPKIYFYEGREFHKSRYEKKDLGKIIWYGGGIYDKKNVLASHRGVDEVDHGQYNLLSETDFSTGCCMLIKKEVFEKIGILDERYFLYLEDLEFCFRAKKYGYKIFYAPDSIIWHINAGSAGGSGSDIQDYFITRNRLLFGFKYAALRARIALLRESMKILFKGRKMQKLGIRDFYSGNFGKGSLKI